MVAANYDRRCQLSSCDEIVERDAKRGALPLAEPADARGKTLKVHLLARECDPLAQMPVVREELEHELIRASEVGWVSRERDPPERPLSFAEERPDVRRDESRERKCFADAGVERDSSNVVAVIERHRAATLQLEHCADMLDNRSDAACYVLRRVISPKLRCRRDIEPARDVAVQRVVCARLIGEYVWYHPPPDELRQHLGSISHQTDGERLLLHSRLVDPREGNREIMRHPVEVSGREALLDARRIDLDAENRGSVHRCRERLRPTHTTEARGEN